MNILFFDAETTGVPIDYKAPITDVDNWPRMVSLAWVLVRENGDPISNCNSIIKPEGFIIPEDSISIHGITNEIAMEKGELVEDILFDFSDALDAASLIVGHNISFDRKVVGAELIRAGYDDLMHGKPRICTMMKSTQYCQLPKAKGNGYKWPKLSELYYHLFGFDYKNQHDAGADVRATIDCFFELFSRGVLTQQDIDKELNKTFEESF
jgi:DNA polymerase III epsilon subunit-like protein